MWCGISGQCVYAAEVTETTVESDAAVEETAVQTTDAEAEAKPEGSTEQPETTEAAEAAVTEATETEETEATEAAESKPVTEMSAAEDVAAVKVTENMKYAASVKCGDNLTWSYNKGVLTSAEAVRCMIIRYMIRRDPRSVCRGMPIKHRLRR